MTYRGLCRGGGDLTYFDFPYTPDSSFYFMAKLSHFFLICDFSVRRFNLLDTSLSTEGWTTFPEL